MTSLVKSSLNGLSGSSSEAVAEGAGRATGEMASGEGARRDPEVVAIARRRQFSGSEKRRLLAEAERCKDAGTLGAFLRREHIYSSMISGWRKQIGMARPRSSPRCSMKAAITARSVPCIGSWQPSIKLASAAVSEFIRSTPSPSS